MAKTKILKKRPSGGYRPVNGGGGGAANHDRILIKALKKEVEELKERLFKLETDYYLLGKEGSDDRDGIG